MKRTLQLLTLAFTFILGANAEEKKAESFKQIPIPKREHGYSNFKSVVISTKAELKAFLKTKAKAEAMGWNAEKKFIEALDAAKIDFSKQALVLLRHTEGSGSVQVTPGKATLAHGKLTLPVARKAPDMGTADMAYYCFALAVNKATVKQVELAVAGRKSTILTIKK
jgi:hypothetical protein